MLKAGCGGIVTVQGADAVDRAAVPAQRGSRPRPGVVGYAPGVYDLFHIGHLNILRHAKARCDFLIAGVVSDEMACRAKGKWPVVPLVERLEIIRHIEFVDEAYAEAVPSKLDVWQELRFDVIFKGGDWKGTPKGDALERDFGPLGVEVVYFPYTVQTSSTILRRALEQVVDEPRARAAFGPGER